MEELAPFALALLPLLLFIPFFFALGNTIFIVVPGAIALGALVVVAIGAGAHSFRMVKATALAAYQPPSLAIAIAEPRGLLLALSLPSSRLAATLAALESVEQVANPTSFVVAIVPLLSNLRVIVWLWRGRNILGTISSVLGRSAGVDIVHSYIPILVGGRLVADSHRISLLHGLHAVPDELAQLVEAHVPHGHPVRGGLVVRLLVHVRPQHHGELLLVDLCSNLILVVDFHPIKLVDKHHGLGRVLAALTGHHAQVLEQLHRCRRVNGVNLLAHNPVELETIVVLYAAFKSCE